MVPRRAGLLAATALGALVGALGGVAAGTLDYTLSAGGAAQFLPDGAGRLALFLVGMYGAAASLAGALLGLLLWGLARTTALGALWRSAFSDEEARSARLEGRAVPTVAGARPVPLLALVVAGLMALGLLGFAVRLVASFALARFHSAMLIAALVGAEAAALAAPAALVALLLEATLGRALPVGPRFDPVARMAPGLTTLGAALGALTGAAGVALVVFAVQQKRRLPPAGKAQQIAIAAPLVLGGALLITHALLRLLAPRLPRSVRAAAERPAAPLLLGLGLGAVAAAGLAVAAWPVVKLLPLKAGGVGVAAPVAALLLSTVGPLRSSVLRLGGMGHAVLAVMLPVVLGASALSAGRADRVRKAASIHAALSGPLLDGLHAAWDVDRDGYSPLLGPDCDDLDAEVHPGAFDWPDDGIDQNCNGHQATVKVPPRPPFAAVPPSVPKRPNVVLITIDALRWDHVGAYGYGRPTTPRIDEWAKEAVLFRNGWAHSPSTRYSVPAILTGRYESTIAWGSDHWPPTVLPENRLLSEMFKDQGYRTAAILPAPYFLPRQANAHMSMWGLDQGFDEYDTQLAPLHSHAGGDPAKATGSSSKQVGDLATSWIAKNAAPQQEKPFFLWVHFYDPHYLYERHEGSPSFGDSDADLYDGEIRFTDTHIGRLFDALRAAGVWDTTVVALTADHGEGLGEHGVKQHGYHIYTAQNKVPFIVRVPGLAPRAADEPVGHIDLFPTFLNLLGAPDEPQLLGRSFVDLMTGGSEPRLVFGEVDYEGPTQRRSVASRTHHLIGNLIPDGTFEYYDLTVDPLEAHDLFERDSGGEGGLLFAALGEWVDESALPRDFAARVAGNLSMEPMSVDRRLGPAGVDLGGLLTLDGVTQKGEAVRPGEEAELQLVMHATAKIPAGWRLFTHVTGGGGMLANLDHDPVENFVPLPKLRPGQWARDRIHFTVSPAWRAAEVRVEVGLARRGEKGWERAAARGAGPDVPVADNAVTVATVRIAR